MFSQAMKSVRESMIHPWKLSALSAIKPCPCLRPLSPERTFIYEVICRLMDQDESAKFDVVDSSWLAWLHLLNSRLNFNQKVFLVQCSACLT